MKPFTKLATARKQAMTSRERGQYRVMKRNQPKASRRQAQVLLAKAN